MNKSRRGAHPGRAAGGKSRRAKEETMSVNHTNPATAADLSGETFGLELEFFGLSRETAARVVATFFGTTYRHIGGSYDKYEIRDPEGRKWTIVYDSSINDSPDFFGEECELNSPVLGWGDLENTCKLVNALHTAGAKTNGDFCGIHVHIGDEKHTPATLRNLVNLTNANEDLLTLALGISPERRGRWCRPVEPRFLRALNAHKPDTLSALARLWYNERDWEYCAHTHYHSSRYRLLNLHSLFQGKGIEFRAFNATFNTDEILADIQLCMALSARAKAIRTASPERPVTDNPKYTFRCLLLRIGMSGDSFKIAREQLIRRLPGNAAWRMAS